MISDMQNPASRKVYSVNEFCVTHGISRAMLYKLWALGKGPRPMSVGTRKLISDESAAEWRRSCEVAAA